VHSTFKIVLKESIVAKFKSHTSIYINHLKPNVNYNGRTAPITSKVAFYVFIQQI